MKFIYREVTVTFEITWNTSLENGLSQNGLFFRTKLKNLPLEMRNKII
jgi:hypothetical protein